MPEPLRIAWIKTAPCEECGTPNGVCARPPGALHEIDNHGRCIGCQHGPSCHEW